MRLTVLLRPVGRSVVHSRIIHICYMLESRGKECRAWKASGGVFVTLRGVILLVLMLAIPR